jgi:anti-sigma factor RsiW
MKCQDARTLIGSYVDGELSNEQGAPLREHLLGCPGCRELAKQGKALERWFATPDPVAVPAGFAAHVARRAVAGDRGSELADEDLRDAVIVPMAARSGAILPFLLKVATVAALLLLCLALAIQKSSLPATDRLQADAYQPPWERQPPDDEEAWSVDVVPVSTQDVPLPEAAEEPLDEDGSHRDGE